MKPGMSWERLSDTNILTISGVIYTEFACAMGRASGYNTYGREGFPRGARVITLQEGERQFETWLHLDDGTRVQEQPEHTPLQRTFTED